MKTFKLFFFVLTLSISANVFALESKQFDNQVHPYSDIYSEFHEFCLRKFGSYPELDPWEKSVLADPELRDFGIQAEELRGIAEYTGGLYKVLNQALREDGDAAKEWLPWVNVMNAGMDKLPDYREVVLRGATLNSDQLNQHEVGSVVIYKGYTSASVDLPFPGNGQLRIKSLHGKRIEKLSSRSYEHEVLFKPSTHFKVVDRRQVDNTIYLDLEEIAK